MFNKMQIKIKFFEKIKSWQNIKNNYFKYVK